MIFSKIVKVGELIRNKNTREVWLIVDKTSQGIMVINLHLKLSPAPILCILQGQSDEWARDIDIDDLEEWEKRMLERKLEQVELKDD